MIKIRMLSLPVGVVSNTFVDFYKRDRRNNQFVKKNLRKTKNENFTEMQKF
jgi:hypothetical protein